jgi:hypothetical protein
LGRGERKNAYRIFMWKSIGKYLIARPRRRWKGYINMNLREIGCEGFGVICVELWGSATTGLVQLKWLIGFRSIVLYLTNCMEQGPS